MAMSSESMTDKIMKALKNLGFNPNDEYSKKYIEALSKGIIEELVTNAETYGDIDNKVFNGKVK